MKPSRTGMITGLTLACNALAIASSEADAGHLVSVCSACISEETKAAIAGLQNLSHGLCDGCTDFAMQEAAKHARPMWEGRAA